MTPKVSILIVVIGMFIACQQKTMVEYSISQSIYNEKIDSNLESRIFQYDEMLTNPDSLPADWERQVKWSMFPDSWFFKYYALKDTVMLKTEISEIIKVILENDSVLDMTVRGWDKLRNILPRYDMAFFCSNDTTLEPLKLKNSLILNFNKHPTSKRGLNLSIYKLPNSILWIEFKFNYPLEYRDRFDSKIIVCIQIKGNWVRPVFTGLVES